MKLAWDALRAPFAVIWIYAAEQDFPDDPPEIRTDHTLVPVTVRGKGAAAA